MSQVIDRPAAAQSVEKSSGQFHRNYINGEWVKPSSTNSFNVLNPATGKLITMAVDSNAADVDQAVAAARAAQPAWERLPAIQRAGFIRAVAQKLRDNKTRLARRISEEQGKILPLAEVEIEFTAAYMDYTSEWARRIEGEILNSDRPGETIYIHRRPIGVVAGILPWNFPFFLIARKMAPALVAGNSIVIKSSEETPLNAFDFTELLHECGLPKGIFNLVTGGRETGAALSAHKDVNLISFTGSVATGSAIMQAAGKNLTRVNLELGGKAPVIVLDDCDLELTANAVVNTRTLNTGQICIAPERIYVQKGIAEKFTDRVTQLMAGIRYGDPFADKDLHMGPLMNQAALDKAVALVESAKKQGAQVRTGGRAADRAGYHLEPTVLTGCKDDMDVMLKEIFAPVLPIRVVGDLDEAIALANNNEYGLTSSVFTQNLNAAIKASRELRYGETYINREHFEAMQGFHAGRRKSGIGGADGKHGLYEYMETQVVYLQTP
jgi:lactaldehyde dehydrogenase / glycolaldehyde dehydrogenase